MKNKWSRRKNMFGLGVNICKSSVMGEEEDMAISCDLKKASDMMRMNRPCCHVNDSRLCLISKASDESS